MGRPIGGPVSLCGGRLDALLEGFACGKRRDLFGGNRDRVTSAWVASCACLTLTEPETAKAPQVHPLLRLQRCHDGLQEPGDHGFRLVFRQLHGGGDLINEICLRHTGVIALFPTACSTGRGNRRRHVSLASGRHKWGWQAGAHLVK